MENAALLQPVGPSPSVESLIFPPVLPIVPSVNINSMFSLKPYEYSANSASNMLIQNENVPKSSNIDPTLSVEQKGTLYLCKKDFSAILNDEVILLKDFLVSQIFETTTSTGWAPTLSMKGLQSAFRYQVIAEDDLSREWLLNFDFSSFRTFDVVVYSNEEPLYKRAAIWLPGHSTTYLHNEPLKKLQMQNRHLVGVNINQWILIQKIITQKGIRIYVDMPSSSARALAKYNMLLSYELQKVNVFLRSVAVDKETFDCGLQELSLSEIPHDISDTPLPTLHYEPGVIRLCQIDDKLLTAQNAQKVKELLILRIYNYYENERGKGRTDFIKFGFCQPGYFAVLPENKETVDWLLSIEIGHISNGKIVVCSKDRNNNKTLKFECTLSHPKGEVQPEVILERLNRWNKQHKGLNILTWNVHSISHNNKMVKMGVTVDFKSAVLLQKLGYKLKYYKEKIKFNHQYKNIGEMLNQRSHESEDIYDVANMEMDSENED